MLCIKQNKKNMIRDYRNIMQRVKYWFIDMTNNKKQEYSNIDNVNCCFFWKRKTENFIQSEDN